MLVQNYNSYDSPKAVRVSFLDLFQVQAGFICFVEEAPVTVQS